MSRAFEKGGLMHLRNVTTHVSLRSPRRLTSAELFAIFKPFPNKPCLQNKSFENTERFFFSQCFLPFLENFSPFSSKLKLSSVQIHSIWYCLKFVVIGQTILIPRDAVFFDKVNFDGSIIWDDNLLVKMPQEDVLSSLLAEHGTNVFVSPPSLCGTVIPERAV